MTNMGPEKNKKTLSASELIGNKADTIDTLTRESNLWMGLNIRVERTGGLDAELLSLRNGTMDRINGHLERLFAQTVQLEAIGLEPGHV